jgi:hypothetical protein
MECWQLEVIDKQVETFNENEAIDGDIFVVG